MRKLSLLCLLLTLQADGLFGCSGRTSATPGQHASSSGGTAGRSGVSASGGAANPHPAQGGTPSKPSAGGATSGTGGSSHAGAGSNLGGVSSDAGAPEQAGDSGVLSGSSGSGVGGLGTGGHSNGAMMCFDNVCGYQCEKDGVIGDPGYDFYVECNKCHCNLNGFPDCEQKDCTKDCAWFADEYLGAFGEAQYCMLDGEHVDPCLRTQASSLPCQCSAPVSSDPEFARISNEWAQKWAAAGCERPAGEVCPPCKPGSSPHCDLEQGICVYAH